MRVRMILVVLLLFYFVDNVTAQRINMENLTPEQKYKLATSPIGKIKVDSLPPVPDSLGGKHLLGSIILLCNVTKDNKLHGYKVWSIEVSVDTIHWFLYASYYDKSLDTLYEEINRKADSVCPGKYKMNLQKGDSLLASFKPWLDEVYKRMYCVGAEKDYHFEFRDTLRYDYEIEFGTVPRSFYLREE